MTVGSAAVLNGKLLQLYNGAVYTNDGAVAEVHRCKVEASLETVEQLRGKHALVAYWYQHEVTRLTQALAGSGLRVRVYRGPEDETAWNAGEAAEATERYRNGRERMKVLQYVFWSGYKGRDLLRYAALTLPCSYDAAQTYHEEFIKLVASNFGLMDDNANIPTRAKKLCYYDTMKNHRGKASPLVDARSRPGNRAALCFAIRIERWWNGQ